MTDTFKGDDNERYAALGRSAEANGLAWYEGDEMLFQPPADYIAEQVAEPLLRALEQAAKWFDEYGDLHAAKPDLVKAERNYERARFLRTNIHKAT